VEAAPFAMVESTAPRPVHRMISPPGSLIFAGCVFTPGIAPAGAAILPSELIATAILLIANMPGENGPTGTVCAVDGVRFRVTTTLTLPVVRLKRTSQGGWAFPCPPLTNSSGD